MFTLEIIWVALTAIRTNLLRSVLTTLGIVIGVAAVIAMVALGEGAQARVRAQIDRMGTNVLTIRPGQEFARGVSRGDSEMSVSDAEALRAETSGLLKVAPEIQSSQQVAYMRWNARTEITGTWPAYFEIYGHTLREGRWFTETEVQGRRRVAVLGALVTDQLGEVPPEVMLGETIQIRGIPFEVIGILEEKGDAGFLDPDEQIFIPISTAQYRVFGGRNRLRTIYAATPTTEQFDVAFAEIDRIMRREHRIPAGEDADFQIRNSADLLETQSEANRTFALLLAGIAGISLLVGGIGIMNIMLVSVTERTREIGVRKALGATRRSILIQFLAEALVLCLFGGLLGVATGYGAAAIITRVAEWETAVATEAVVAALGFSAGVGVFFGIWPARRAARLDPIVALRYE